MKKVYIYTDGACSGNPGAGGWGAHKLPCKTKIIARETEEGE